MCRWLAYIGRPVALDTLLTEPEHSLLVQSQDAADMAYKTNGDGFGIGWYTSRPGPGVYHDVRPAWNDRNLRSLAEHIESPLFMGHVRLAVGSEVSRLNCHPFTHERWLFQHNGEVHGFSRIKQEVDALIDPALYGLIGGQTDSERLFYLALTFGLEKDAPGALRRMVETVEGLREDAGIAEPFRMTIAVADGSRLFVARHASSGEPPSLYRSENLDAVTDAQGIEREVGGDGVIIVSEPLDKRSDHWRSIDENTLLHIRPGEIEAEPLLS